MKVREEIERYSSDKDKPILLFLLQKYSMRSQFLFVATCTFVKYGYRSYESNRVWAPTEEGIILYNHYTHNH